MGADRIARDAFSIGLATGVYAISFGVLSVAAGLSVAQTCVLSLACFTGASQFSYVSVIGAGGSVLAALGPSVLLAARNGVYALSLRSVLRRPPADAHLVIDETTAMALAQDGEADPPGVPAHGRIRVRLLEHRDAHRRSGRRWHRPA